MFHHIATIASTSPLSTTLARTTYNLMHTEFIVIIQGGHSNATIEMTSTSTSVPSQFAQL
jgi:hypothetical protein